MRSRCSVALALVAALVLGAPAARAATPALEATLDNGLRVITMEDHRTPLVNVQVWYHVGSKDEDPQRQGVNDRRQCHIGLLRQFGRDDRGLGRGQLFGQLGRQDDALRLVAG